MADHKVVLRLLVLLLAFSLVFSNTVAVPWTRSLEAISASLLAQDLQDQQMAKGGVVEEEESFVRGRMDIETSDYSGTGANPRHDPTPPGSH